VKAVNDIGIQEIRKIIWDLGGKKKTCNLPLVLKTFAALCCYWLCKSLPGITHLTGFIQLTFTNYVLPASDD
jgi:hypothetical protein